MAEPQLSHGVHAVRSPAGVEHIGHQHGVVERRDLDAVARQHLHVILQVLPDLEDALVLEQRLEDGERLRNRHLRGHDLAWKEAGAVAALAVDQRHVAGGVGADREREAAQLRLHRIEARGLGVDRNHAGIDRARDPGAQFIDRAHRLVARAVERRGLGRSDAGFGERLRGRTAGGRNGCGFLCGGRRRGTEGEFALARCGRARRRREFENGRRCASPEYRIRLDLGGIGAGEFGDAADQRCKFHRLEEGDEAFGVRIMHREIGERHVERHFGVECDERLRQPRLVGILDQRLAPFLLLDLRGAREQRFEVAILADELSRGLDADAGNAGNIVGRIADQRLDLDHLVRRDAEFLDHLGGADAAVLHGVVHGDAVGDELHQSPCRTTRWSRWRPLRRPRAHTSR